MWEFGLYPSSLCVDGVDLYLKKIRAEPGRLGEARAMKKLLVPSLQVFDSRIYPRSNFSFDILAPDFDVYQPSAVGCVRRNLSVSGSESE